MADKWYLFSCSNPNAFWNWNLGKQFCRSGYFFWLISEWSSCFNIGKDFGKSLCHRHG